MNINKLRQVSMETLLNLGKHVGLDNISSMNKQDIITSIIEKNRKLGNDLLAFGVLEILTEGFGFLRSVISDYLPGPDDIYVSSSQIKKFSLRTGDTISGIIRLPIYGERFFTLLKIHKINFELVHYFHRTLLFKNLTPLHSNIRLKMEYNDDYNMDCTPRILDLLTPIGKGQRGLIVAPPKAGKTILLKNIAKSILFNHPDCVLMILLIDERPEEVTDMKRSVSCDIIASTFDESAFRHIQIANIVLSKAKRLVESQKDVIILLDSITRLSRAYNTITPTSGRILTGGIDANALTRPKRFFGAARNLAEGGSLTIIATALIDTGSKMDEVIYEEFKGTGNMELHLSRQLSEQRIFPAIDYKKSGTRKEEIIISYYELKNLWMFRKILQSLSEIDAIKYIMDKIFLSNNNYDLLSTMIHYQINDTNI